MDDKVSLAVEVILADRDRQGTVTKDDVHRVLQRRQLDSAEMVRVLQTLAANGIDYLSGVGTDHVAKPATVQAGTNNSASGQVGDSQSAVIRQTADAAPNSGAGIDGFGRFLRRMGQIALLTAEQEVKLGRRVRAGQDAQAAVDHGGLSPSEARSILHDAARAREAFLVANLRLVVNEARQPKYNGRGLDLEDRVQEAFLGLMRAVDKFDPERGIKFSTYATWWVKQSLERGLDDKGCTIRIPVHLHEQARKVRRAQHKLQTRLGRVPTLPELADDVELEPSEAAYLLDVVKTPVSLEHEVGDGDTTLGELVAKEHIVSPETTYVRERCREDLGRILKFSLDERSTEVLLRRYGHGPNADDGCDTLEDIGEELGVTRERIRQLQNKALGQLRANPAVRTLRTYLETT